MSSVLNSLFFPSGYVYVVFLLMQRTGSCLHGLVAEGLFMTEQSGHVFRMEWKARSSRDSRNQTAKPFQNVPKATWFKWFTQFARCKDLAFLVKQPQKRCRLSTDPLVVYRGQKRMLEPAASVFSKPTHLYLQIFQRVFWSQCVLSCDQFFGFFAFFARSFTRLWCLCYQSDKTSSDSQSLNVASLQSKKGSKLLHRVPCTAWMDCLKKMKRNGSIGSSDSSAGSAWGNSTCRPSRVARRLGFQAWQDMVSS